MKSLLLSIGLLCIITACKPEIKNTSDNSGIEVIKLDPDNAATFMKFSDIFSKIEFLPLETNEKCLIGEISNLLIYEDYIFIADDEITKSVFVFGTDGSFKYKIAGQGRGPNEYLNLGNMYIEEETRSLVLSCDEDCLFYNIDDGTFIERRSGKIDYDSIEYVSKDVYAYYISYGYPKDYKHSLIIDNEGIISEFFPMPEYLMGIVPTSRRLFNAYNSDRNLYFTPNYKDTIYQILPDGPKPLRYVDFGDKKPPEKVLGEVKEKEFMGNKGIDIVTGYGKYCGIIGDYFETSVFYYFKYSYNSMPYLYLKLKNTEKVIHTQAYRNTVDDMTFNLLGSFGDFLYAGDSYLASYANANEFDNLMEMYLIYNEAFSDGRIPVPKKELESIRESVEKMNEIYGPIMSELSKKDENDNPVLVFFHLKD